jgi:hypothetical protein
MMLAIEYNMRYFFAHPIQGAVTKPMRLRPRMGPTDSFIIERVASRLSSATAALTFLSDRLIAPTDVGDATRAKPAKAGDAKLRGYREVTFAMPVEPPNEPLSGVYSCGTGHRC